ncbi:EG45-like domain containing protein [Nymphaea thermarum]|nr:EG45-like domain containing protein [Nymphaea thermarum]
MGRAVFFRFRILLSLVTALGLLSLSLADDGTATYSSPPYVPTACYGYQDNGVMVAAANDEIWNGGAACGTFYSVTCTDASGACAYDAEPVVVQIVDYCSNCAATLVLSFEAFSAIADPNAGVISVDYEQ